MKINVGRGGRSTSDGWGNLVALVVLAGQLFALVQLCGIHARLANLVRSAALRIGLYAAVFLGLSVCGLALWPRIRTAIAWAVWVLGFGFSGACFLYLSIAGNFGRGFSLIYGPLFLAYAMIGISGLGRVAVGVARQRLRARQRLAGEATAQ